jgi:hypothetical protein
MDKDEESIDGVIELINYHFCPRPEWGCLTILWLLYRYSFGPKFLDILRSQDAFAREDHMAHYRVSILFKKLAHKGYLSVNLKKKKRVNKAQRATRKQQRH